MRGRLILGLFLWLSACSTNYVQQDQDRAENAVQASSLALYFLPLLPAWANYAARGGCFRNKPVQFIDLAALGKSFNLTYHQLIQFQGIYNELWREDLARYQRQDLPAPDQEKIFYQVLEKVRSNIGGVDVPEHDRLNILWIDPFLAAAQQAERKGPSAAASSLTLSSLLAAFVQVQEEFVAQGHPLLMSTCLDQDALRGWQQKLGLHGEDVRYIDLGHFSPYSPSGVMLPGEVIDGAAFLPEKKVYLYVPKDLVKTNLPWLQAGKLRPF